MRDGKIGLDVGFHFGDEEFDIETFRPSEGWRVESLDNVCGKLQAIAEVAVVVVGADDVLVTVHGVVHPSFDLVDHVSLIVDVADDLLAVGAGPGDNLVFRAVLGLVSDGCIVLHGADQEALWQEPNLFIAVDIRVRLQAVAVGLAHGIASLVERSRESNDGPVGRAAAAADNTRNTADVPGIFAVDELQRVTFDAEHGLRRKSADGTGLKTRSGNGEVDGIDIRLDQIARARCVAVLQLPGGTAAGGELQRLHVLATHGVQRAGHNGLCVLSK